MLFPTGHISGDMFIDFTWFQATELQENDQEIRRNWSNLETNKCIITDIIL